MQIVDLDSQKMDITEWKKSFELPINKDEMEYFGPIDHQLSSAFLDMGHDFMQSYFSNIPRTLRKKLFTVFIELIQNIADYNEKSSNQNSRAFVKLTVDSGEIIIKTVNFVAKSDLENVKVLLEKTFELDEEDLQAAYKVALMNGESLGLIMIRSIKEATFEYKFDSNETMNYLTFEYRMRE
jgi:hypothetical protein